MSKIRIATIFLLSATILSACEGVTPYPTPPTIPSTAPATEVPSPTVSPSPLAITPENAKNVVQLTQWGKGETNSITWSPDGKLLAVASALGIYIHDASSLKQIRFIKTQYPAFSVTFSPDSKSIIAGGCEFFRTDVISCARSWMNLYDAKSGENIVQFEIVHGDYGLTAFSPIGNIIASASCNDNRGIGVGCVQTKIDTVGEFKSGG